MLVIYRWSIVKFSLKEDMALHQARLRSGADVFYGIDGENNEGTSAYKVASLFDGCIQTLLQMRMKRANQLSQFVTFATDPVRR